MSDRAQRQRPNTAPAAKVEAALQPPVRQFGPPQPATESTAAVSSLEAELPADLQLGHDFARLQAPASFEPPTVSVVQGKLVGAEQAARKVLRPSGAGRGLPDPVRTKMESSLGADFSGVRVHEGTEAPSIGAVAYTRGSNIHFAPGKYQPNSATGQRLLGHELTHVVQQREGRVKAPAGARIPINDSAALEREADVLGAKAASGTGLQKKPGHGPEEK